MAYPKMDKVYETCASVEYENDVEKDLAGHTTQGSHGVNYHHPPSGDQGSTFFMPSKSLLGEGALVGAVSQARKRSLEIVSQPLGLGPGFCRFVWEKTSKDPHWYTDIYYWHIILTILSVLASQYVLPRFRDKVKALGQKKALIVTDAVLVKVGAVKALTDVLDDAGIGYSIYDGCQPNPTVEQVDIGATCLCVEYFLPWFFLNLHHALKPTCGKASGGNNYPRQDLIIRWWFQAFLIFAYFHQYLGRWSNVTNIFHMAWNHELGSHKIFAPQNLVPWAPAHESRGQDAEGQRLRLCGVFWWRFTPRLCQGHQHAMRQWRKHQGLRRSGQEHQANVAIGTWAKDMRIIHDT